MQSFLLFRVLRLHMPAQEASNGLHQLVVGFAGFYVVIAADKQNTAQHISLGEDGGGAGDEIFVVLIADKQRVVPCAVLVNLPALHNLLQFGGNPLVGQLPARRARHRNAGIPVGNHSNLTGGFVERLTHLPGKVSQTAHEGVFLKNDFAVFVGVYLQWVALADTHSPADFLGNDHPAQVIPLCQVGAKIFLVS